MLSNILKVFLQLYNNQRIFRHPNYLCSSNNKIKELDHKFEINNRYRSKT